jgi:hypothetical protein
MLNRKVFFAVLVFALLHSIPASAAWTALQAFGTTVTATSDPSCAFLSNGKAVCAVRTLSHNLAVNVYNGVAWGVAQNLVGVVTSKPSCTDNGAGKVFCVARGTTGALFATIYNGTV